MIEVRLDLHLILRENLNKRIVANRIYLHLENLYNPSPIVYL